ncbi:hypothetical protein CDS [Bradyrhizobium sp.]|nr:hypothetical protein CDS [Bradyrhizobium sp.]
MRASGARDVLNYTATMAAASMSTPALTAGSSSSTPPTILALH